MSTWEDSARAAIQRVHAALPADISHAERKKAVDAAYPFGARKHWPYEAWLKARRGYLGRYSNAPNGPLFNTAKDRP